MLASGERKCSFYNSFQVLAAVTTSFASVSHQFALEAERLMKRQKCERFGERKNMLSSIRFVVPGVSGWTSY